MLIEEIDRYIHKKFSRMIVKGVRKHDENKYKVWLRWKKRYLVIFALMTWVFLPVTYLMDHIPLAFIGLITFIWTLHVLVQTLNYHTYGKDKAEWYDQYWQRRKNPAVYEAVRISCEHFFHEYSRHRKYNIGFVVFYWLLVIGIFFFESRELHDLYFLYVAGAFSFLLIEEYLNSIFDFEEADDEKKKIEERVSLTEVARKAWERTVGGVLQPGGSQI